MKQTQTYQLSQWEPADRILMEDFNADNTKIEAAILSRLGPIEVIQTQTPAAAVQSMTLDLTGFDWSIWTMIALKFQGSYTASTSSNPAAVLRLDGPVGKSLSFTQTPAGSALLVLFPGRDPERLVCCVGFPDGKLAMNTFAYQDLTGFSLAFANARISAGSVLTLCGIR